MEEEFYIWQTSVEELDEGEVNILMDTIEDGLMLTYSNGFEETICKLKFKKGWLLECKSDEADWVECVAENISKMPRDDLSKVLSIMAENAFGISLGDEGGEDMNMNSPPQYEEEKEFLREESTNTIEEEVKMEELSKRLGMSVTHGSNPIYIKGFEQSIIYTKTLEAMKFMNTGKDKELAYLCSVSLHPEIQVIRLQLDLNFLDVSQAILDNLGFVFTETVNILLEYQTYSVANLTSNTSLSEMLKKGQIRVECNQGGKQDVFGCEYLVQIVKKYFDYYSRFSAAIQKEMPLGEEFLNIMFMIYMNAMGADEDQIANALILKNNNLQPVLALLGLDSHEYLPLYIKELTDEKTKHPNLITNIILYTKHMIESCQDYCIICLGKLGGAGGFRISPCTSQFCQFSFEESFGAKLYPEIQNNIAMINLDLSLASNSLSSGRALDVFEPFPTFFLHDREMRGKAGFLTDKKTKVDNKNKDLGLLRKYFGGFPDLGLLLEGCGNETDIKALFNSVYEGTGEDGRVGYKLMKYVVATNRLHLVPLTGGDRISEFHADVHQFIVTSHTYEEEERFGIQRKTHGSVYLFHGSAQENWYSILRNGLKNLSNSHMMTAGAAYGAGIYASSNMGTSFGYSSRGGYYNQGMGGTHTAASGRWKYGKYMNYVVMAIIEVIKKKEYDKGSWNVATIPNDDDVIIRYLLLIPAGGTGAGTNATTTNMKLEKHYTSYLSKIRKQRESNHLTRRKQAIKRREMELGEERKIQDVLFAERKKREEEAVKREKEMREEKAFEDRFKKLEEKFIGQGSQMATQRILSEYKYLLKSRDMHHCLVEFIKDSVYQWKMTFDIMEYDLSKELKQDYLKIIVPQEKPMLIFEILFSAQFPFDPPFIRVVKPRFAFHTGHITIGGSICMEVLTKSGWTAAFSMENLMLDILVTICSGGGRLDGPRWAQEYTLFEAQDAFKRVASQHGWL